MVLLSVVFFSSPAAAHSFKAGDLVIGHPWARAAAPPNGAAYLTITNQGQTPDRLVRVSSPAAEMSQLHVHLVEDGIMKMRPIDGIDIEPGAPVELKPGGLHIMLMGLKAPLTAGMKFPLTLSFEKAGDVTVEVWVETAGAMESGHDGHPMH